jgi:hypothetical protein
MVGGPWAGRAMNLTPEILAQGRFDAEEPGWAGEYLQEPHAPLNWVWQPSAHATAPNADYRVEIWNKDFDEPQAIVLDGSVDRADVEQRFEHVCQTIAEGRESGAPLVFLTWADVAGGDGITLEPRNIVKVVAIGPDMDLTREV